MLKSILIHNIVLIDRLEIDFSSNAAAQNFCVLTGETGSGKSILLDALGLGVGYRSSNRLLRKDANQGQVIAQFDISENTAVHEILLENGLLNEEDKNSLILRRVLLQGSSKAFVNDVPVGVNLLHKIGSCLIEIHGQHEQSNLLEKSFHLKILDLYANHPNLVESVQEIFTQLAEVRKKLQKLHEEKQQNEREQDYLEHVIKELETADVQIGEEETLTVKRNKILNFAKISSLINEVNSDVNEADSRLFSASKNLIRNQNLGNFISEEENKLEKLTEILDQILSKNEEMKSELDDILRGLDIGEESLEAIEERLFLLRSLSRKHGCQIDELPKILEKTREKLQIVENFSVVAVDLEKKQKELEAKYLSKARELQASRNIAAQKLTNKVQEELAFLKMSAVQFAVQIAEKPEFSANGIDDVKFAAATNASSNLDDIAKIASGGELSRFMLALKVALLQVKSTPILIFDEIDSGIGGAVADAVGNRLKLLSKKAQILVVTHHPQIAAKGDFHLRVEKNTIDSQTKTSIAVLNDLEQEREVARMLSGEQISDEAIAAAKKLMTN